MLDLNVFKIEFMYLHDALKEVHVSSEEAFEICQAVYKDFSLSAFNSPYKTFEACFEEYLNSFRKVNEAAISTCEFLDESSDCVDLLSSNVHTLVSKYLNK